MNTGCAQESKMADLLVGRSAVFRTNWRLARSTEVNFRNTLSPTPSVPTSDAQCTTVCMRRSSAITKRIIVNVYADRLCSERTAWDGTVWLIQVRCEIPQCWPWLPAVRSPRRRHSIAHWSESTSRRVRWRLFLEGSWSRVCRHKHTSLPSIRA